MKSFKKYSYLKLGLFALLLGACTPEDPDLSLGSLPSASFSVEPASQNNRYVLTNTTEGSFATYWDTGNGFEVGDAQQTIFLPDAGTYDVRMIAVASGGVDTASVQTINVETPDPVAGNLVMGARMDDPSAWTFLKINNDDNVTFSIADGKMLASGGNWGHAGMYQAIDVEAGKTYNFAARVSGAGATDVWLEVYFGKVEPTQLQDYSDGGNMIGLNTWGGCGNSAFNGNLANIGCSGALVGKGGEVTFAESGTIYLVIKSGGGNLGTGGITIDNVELRGTAG